MAYNQEEYKGRPEQLMALCMEFNLFTKYIAHITFDGKNDLFVVKLSKGKEVLFSSNIKNLSKKTPAYVEKEMAYIAELLIKHKN